jgi:hypothetical protein
MLAMLARTPASSIFLTADVQSQSPPVPATDSSLALALEPRSASNPVTLRWLGNRVGLHHLCLRARSREDVDRCAALLKEMNATIVRGPMEGSWAPGYYYVPHCHINGLRLPSSSLVPQSSGKGKGTLSVFRS